MQVEVGKIVEGKVTGITHFGAFVALPGGETGMVHISEVSDAYVKEIGDYISEDQEIKVKILAVADDGKISLSMKQCEENAALKPKEQEQEQRPQRNVRPRQNNRPREAGWQPKPQQESEDMSFEDMLTRFKQVSNDRMGELKRANDPRRSRRGNSYR